MLIRPSGMNFRRLWPKNFCSQSVRKIQANSKKHFSQTVRLDSLQNAVLTTLLKTLRLTSGGFRAQSEKFSQITYFGHVESNFENHNRNFCLKLRKVFKKVYLNNVPSDLKTRSFGNPPNKVTQKAVLTNFPKSFLLGARKMFKKIVTQKWSIAQK